MLAQITPNTIKIVPMNVCLASANLPPIWLIKSLSEASCGIVNSPIANRNDPRATNINHGAVIDARPIFFPISLLE